MGILRKTEELIPVTCAILSAAERESFFDELKKRASGNIGRIAKTVGTTVAVVQDWIHGRLNVPYHALQVMADEFKVTLPPVSELRREMQLVVEPPKPRHAPPPPPPPPAAEPRRERKPARSRNGRGSRSRQEGGREEPRQERGRDEQPREEHRREETPHEEPARQEQPQEQLTAEEREMREHMRQEAERQERSRLAREHALHGTPLPDHRRERAPRNDQRRHEPRQGQRRPEGRREPHHAQGHSHPQGQGQGQGQARGGRQEGPRRRPERGRKERSPRPERAPNAPRPQHLPKTSKDPRLSDRLAYWTGVLLARTSWQDGSVVLSADSRIGQGFAEVWASLTTDLFGLKPELSMSEDGLVQKASFPASELEVFLGRLSYKEGSRPSSASGAPRWAWSNPDWKTAFLKGVVDSSAQFQRSPRLALAGLSEDMRRSAAKMLGSLGISPKTGTEVSLEGREAVAAYFEKIGAQNSKLRDRISAYLKGEPPTAEEEAEERFLAAAAPPAELPAPEQALSADKASTEARLPDPETLPDAE